MNKSVFLRFLCALCVIYGINADDDTAPFCEPYKPDILFTDPNELPKLPKEFQTRAELTMGYSRAQTVNMIIYYDYYDKKTALTVIERDDKGSRKIAHEVMLYAKNELFQFVDNQCNVQNLTDTGNINFFGINITSDGLLPFVPEEVLHFNYDKYNTIKDSQTTYRGIPVNHYKSCQNYSLFNANFRIDYYFKIPEYQQGVANENFNEIPVAAIVEGISEINPTTMTGRKFRNEYNYFEFRPMVTDSSVFEVPEGLYCNNQNDKSLLPQIPYDFSFTEEVIENGKRSGKTTKVYYSYIGQVARFDSVAKRTTNNAIDNFKIIHDFNSGIAYKIDKQTNMCTISSIGNDLIDSLSIPSGLASSLVMKTPMQMFFLDDTYIFVGERMERGILCRVFISNRTDFIIPNSEITDSATAIKHFKKDENTVNLNIMLANFKFESSSAEDCASFCLNTTTFDSKPFKCLSFDYCPMQQICSFYSSTDTDPSVISESSPVCEHHSKKPNNRIFEIYFMSLRQSNIGSDQIEKVTPVAIKITSSELNINYALHIYDFDSKPDAEAFDFSQCFQAKERIEFGIRYRYPENFDVASFRTKQKDLLDAFYGMELFQVEQLYSFSPLRIINPTLVPLKDSFILYSGITNTAPAIYHFQKKNQVKVNLQLSTYKIKTSSAEACAKFCLDTSVIDSDAFKCLSFDYCASQEGCSFYNFTLTTDPSIITESSPNCDHYSKTVSNFDAASKEVIYRAIEDLVVKGDFDLNTKDENDVLKEQFKCVEIFPTTLQASADNANDIPIGTTSFYKQFFIISFDADFNLDEMIKDKSIIVRQKKGISIDECTRLCLKEPAFQCETLTYEPTLTECKWSSFVGSLLLDVKNNTFIMSQPGYTFFNRDPLYSYIKYSSQTTTLSNSKIIDASSENECAYACTNEKNFTCKSFNLCKNDDKYKCLLSKTHINNENNNPDIVYSPICTHYSKNTVEDFKLVPQTQLNVKPQTKLFNTTVDVCAETCTFVDSFICRSFDFFTDSTTCHLYEKNLRDINFPDVQGIDNVNCSHYSRVYITENGLSNSIQILTSRKTISKYSGGTIFGIVLALGLVTTILGFGLAFLIIKRIKENKLLPTMKFINPNYLKE